MESQHKAVAAEFDGYQENYNDTVNQALLLSGLKVDFFTRVKADYLRDLLHNTFGETASLQALDVGCGIGNYHPLLKKDLGGLTGVDVSKACVAKARDANPDVGYASYDGDRLPFEDGSFDVTFTICVMHHVPPKQWRSFLSEMWRVLRPGGLAVVFEHNPRNKFTKRIVNRCPFDRDAVLLDLRNTAELFSLAGFQNVENRFILTLPAANSTLRMLDGLFGGLPLGAQYYVAGRKEQTVLDPRLG